MLGPESGDTAISAMRATIATANAISGSNAIVFAPMLAGATTCENDSIYAILLCMNTIVLDTNVFVNALLSTHDGSRSRAVVRACIAGQHEPLFGIALFREYEDVLSRAALFSRSQASAAERAEVFGALLHRARWVEIYFTWRPNLFDEGDNHLIELAVAGGAEALVTRNIADFKRAELKFPDLAILTPEQFLKVHPCQP